MQERSTVHDTDFVFLLKWYDADPDRVILILLFKRKSMISEEIPLNKIIPFRNVLIFSINFERELKVLP